MSSLPLIPPVVVLLALTVVTVLIQYEGLRLISLSLERIRSRPRPRMLIVIFGILIIHFIEIALFAFGLYVVDRLPYESSAGVSARPDAFGYFYMSAQTFSTLGFGDYLPLGNMRILASVQPILGLLMIGWSTSFTFLAMQKLWALHPRRQP